MPKADQTEAASPGTTIVSTPSDGRVAGGVERAGAAVGHEHEVARVEAAADDLVLQRRRHLRVGDLDDAERRVGDREAERLGDLLADRLLGEVAARLEAAALAFGAEGRLGGDVAEDQVGVGDRRLLPPRS